MEKRRNLTDQVVKAAFGIHGNWKPLELELSGSLLDEKEFALYRGALDERVNETTAAKLAKKSSPESFELCLLDLEGDKVTQDYSSYLEFLRTLRVRSGEKPSAIFIETPIPGLTGEEYGDPKLSLKQVYLDVLKLLEEKMKRDEYVAFHERMLSEADSEDPEHRLCVIIKDAEISKLVGEPEFLTHFDKARMRVLAKEHASKSFESSFIAGDEKEMQELLAMIDSKTDWESFSKKYPEDEDKALLSDSVLDFATSGDALLPRKHSETWNALEKKAGRFFDFLCGKTFNRLSRDEKFRMTGLTKYAAPASDQPKQDLAPAAPSLHKFKLDADPMSSLLGGTPAGPSLDKIEPAAKESLNEYGDTFLALLIGALRKTVYIGGALYEYSFIDPEGKFKLGTAVVVATDPKLTKIAGELAKELGVPKRKKNFDEKKVLQLFFDFFKNYTKYYDKVRSGLKPLSDNFLGTITEADYEAKRPRVDDVSVEEKERLKKARRERERRAQEQARKKAEAQELKVKKLKEQKEKEKEQERLKKEQDQKVKSKDTDFVPQAPKLSEEEKKELEEKRAALEMEMEERTLKKEELEKNRKRIEEEHKRRKAEQEALMAKRREQEKLERQRRQERLNEERRRRDEVRAQRENMLRSAFEKAREKAQKKAEDKGSRQGSKDPRGKRGQQQKSISLSDLKKSLQGDDSASPEEIKTMIRFGTDLDTIHQKTGVDMEDLLQYQEEVNQE